MKDEILKMLTLLKLSKIPTSRVERDLGFSNGLLGKAAISGYLSADKFESLKEYFNKTFAPKPIDVVKEAAEKRKELKDFCEKNGIQMTNELPSVGAIITGTFPRIKSENELIGEGLVEFCRKNKISVEQAMGVLDHALVAKTMIKPSGKVSVQNFTKENPKSNFSIDTKKSEKSEGSKMSFREIQAKKAQGLL